MDFSFDWDFIKFFNHFVIKSKQIWDPSAAEGLAGPPEGKEHPYKTNNHLRQGGVFEELWPFSGENYIFSKFLILVYEEGLPLLSSKTIAN